jgi:uroporphyrinogen decarboxylase
MGTTAMKSVFTTATRFLGMEKALVQLLTGELEEGLNQIADEMLLWNKYLLETYPFGGIKIGVQGDDIGTSRGMMISPELYRKYLKPIHKKFVALFEDKHVPLWYHSDGDISAILSDIEEIGYVGVYYEDIGDMEVNLAKAGLQGREVIR